MVSIQEGMLEWLEPRWSKAERPLSGSGVDVRDSVRDAIVAALGCHPRLGLLGYWEVAELRPLRSAALDSLGGHEFATRYRVSASDLWPELRDAVLSCWQLSELEAPESVTVRPWCDPKVVSTGRIPFVPVASVCQVALSAHRAGGLKAACDELGVSRTEDPWMFMDRTDPTVREQDPAAGTAELATAIVAYCDAVTRKVPAGSLDAVLSPAHMLEIVSGIDVDVSALAGHLLEIVKGAA